MNRTKLAPATLRRNLGAAGVSTALAAMALSAQAAPTTTEMQQVKAYGNISVAQDSAGSWGPWEEFEAPAAGPTQPLGLARAAGDPYRPLANPNPPTGGTPETPTPPAPTLQLVGWGSFFESNEQGCQGAPCAPMQMTGTAPIPATGILPPSMELTLNSLDTGEGAATLLFSNTGTLTLQQGEGSGGYLRQSDTERILVVAEPGTENPVSPELIQAAFVRMNLTRYLAGGESSTSQDVYAVLGVATPAADMSDLRAIGAVARFNGRDQYAGTVDGIPQNNVSMVVNFGTGDMHGTWNKGVDGPGVVQAANGSLTGPVGFWMVGKVSGSSFQSTSISALDGTVDNTKSSIRGSFYGQNAIAAGGVADVTKTRQGVYSGGRFTAPFLTVKVESNPR